MKIQRLIIGVLGGYLVTSLLSVTFAFVWEFSKMEAILLSSILSYTIWLCLIFYAFSAVRIKNLLFQFSLISINLYFINACLIAAKA